MSKTVHTIYISVLSLIVVLVLILLIYFGSSYYNTSIEERFYHDDYQLLKPSGPIGHGLGIIGSLLMIIGVSSYMARKRMKSLARVGSLKHWLEFHIFLCTLGPILVLFHTSFKFGGLVSVSFWSMVAVFLSGVIGRFIYIQIPRSIEGRELSLQEVKNMKFEFGRDSLSGIELDEESLKMIAESTHEKSNDNQSSFWKDWVVSYFDDQKTARAIKKQLKTTGLGKKEMHKVIRLVKNELSLNRRINRLLVMQNIFKYWHVAHLPFAIVMLVIMIIHVIVTVMFGYRWIF